MTTVETSITRVRRLVGDVAEQVFSDAKLIRALGRAQQEWCRDTRSLLKVVLIASPPQPEAACTQQWEEAYAGTKKSFVPFFNDGAYAATQPWELDTAYDSTGGYTCTCGSDAIYKEPQHRIPSFFPDDFYACKGFWYDYKWVDQRPIKWVEQSYLDAFIRTGTVIDFWAMDDETRKKAFLTHPLIVEDSEDQLNVDTGELFVNGDCEAGEPYIGRVTDPYALSKADVGNPPGDEGITDLGDDHESVYYVSDHGGATLAFVDTTVYGNKVASGYDYVFKFDYRTNYGILPPFTVPTDTLDIDITAAYPGGVASTDSYTIDIEEADVWTEGAEYTFTSGAASAGGTNLSLSIGYGFDAYVNGPLILYLDNLSLKMTDESARGVTLDHATAIDYALEDNFYTVLYCAVPELPTMRRQSMEVQDIFLKYVEYGAIAKLLAYDTSIRDRIKSQHYRMRYMAAVRAMRRVWHKAYRDRVHMLTGGVARGDKRPPAPRFPDHYPEVEFHGRNRS